MPRARSTSATSEGPETEPRIAYHAWDSAPEFGRGAFTGAVATAAGVCIGEPAEYGQWTSPVQAPGFPATELIASWNADTPPGTWLRVSARTRTSTGAVTPWYVLAEWAHGDTDIRRTTIPGQDDEHAAVDVDTLTVEPGVRLHAYQLRVSLLRVAGSQVTPVLRAVGALASALPDRFTVPVSAPGRARGIELPVPRFAQNVHRGNYPEYGGGGESWCSPASTAMVLAYWGRGPDAAELAWLPPGYPDRPVAHAARCTYDHAYHGTGNWPFNTAYAAHYGLRGRVTRLRSLTELEDYLADGVPVITSQSFLASELDGAGYDTAGHLLVVTGCTEDGDVIVNDPAADDVRRVYPRAQFETIWQRTRRHTADGTVAGGPGGIAYLIEP